MTSYQEGGEVYNGPSPEEKGRCAEERAKIAKAAEAFSKQQVKPAENAEEVRVFVAPLHKECSFLVRPGRLVSFPDPNSPGGTKDVRREGDVWAVFTAGYLATTDPVVIAWCEAHPDICRDARDPRTPAWVALREGQRPAGWREALIDPSIDIDGIIFGDREAAMESFAPEKSRLIQDALAAAEERQRKQKPAS